MSEGMSEASHVGHPTRRILLRSMLQAFLVTTTLLILFYELPFRGNFSDASVVLLPVGLLGFGVLSYRGVRGIISSSTPRVRAIQVLATTVPFFLVMMATTYYLMEVHQAKSFNVPLTRTDALYFTVTVFSTVGFGDIAPVSEWARVVAMVQMLGDLVIIGAGVQVLLGAIRISVGRRDTSLTDPLPDEPKLF